MAQTNVVLFQSDANVAQVLAALLSNSFHRVQVVRSLDELRHSAAKHRPYAIILDLETTTLDQLESLKQEFQGVRIICNHRVADEEMWAKTLTAGADDFCRSSDTRGIVMAAIPKAAAAARTLVA
jgi:DNA-binding NarL/FixJ family response regulator